MAEAATPTAAPKIDLKELVSLDRGKPFGIVTPPHEGAHYDQDGFLFDQNGALVEALLTHEGRSKLQRLSFKKQADAAAAAAKREAYAKMGVSDAGQADIEAAAAPAASAAPAADGVDIIAWALGQKVYPWPVVRKAAEEAYHVSVISADQLREWMQDNGMVAAPGK